MHGSDDTLARLHPRFESAGLVAMAWTYHALEHGKHFHVSTVKGSTVPLQAITHRRASAMEVTGKVSSKTQWCSVYGLQYNLDEGALQHISIDCEHHSKVRATKPPSHVVKAGLSGRRMNQHG
jgi:hypothetical protein